MKTVLKTILCAFAVLALVVLIGAVLPHGCTDEDAARKALRGAGYTNIQITGWRPMMAGEGDTFSTGFSAVGPTGQPVTGAVTSGVFKGSTIRTD